MDRTIISSYCIWIFLSSSTNPCFSLGIGSYRFLCVAEQLAKEQLAQRQLALVIQWAVIIAAIAVWFVPQLQQFFNLGLMLWGLVICLIYAVFAGWVMKISHLRKAMGFSNELFYNLWRIAVRLVLPISIVIAMIAVIGQII